MIVKAIINAGAAEAAATVGTVARDQAKLYHDAAPVPDVQESARLRDMYQAEGGDATLLPCPRPLRNDARQLTLWMTRLGRQSLSP